MKELDRFQAEQFEFERLHKLFDEIYSYIAPRHSGCLVSNRVDAAILATYCLKSDIKFEQIIPIYERCKGIANVDPGDSATLATGLVDLIKRYEKEVK